MLWGQWNVGELDFGPEAVFDGNAHRLRWYDYWLKGMENGIMDGPAVRIFLMGEKQRFPTVRPEPEHRGAVWGGGLRTGGSQHRLSRRQRRPWHLFLEPQDYSVERRDVP